MIMIPTCAPEAHYVSRLTCRRPWAKSKGPQPKGVLRRGRRLQRVACSAHRSLFLSSTKSGDTPSFFLLRLRLRPGKPGLEKAAASSRSPKRLRRTLSRSLIQSRERGTCIPYPLSAPKALLIPTLPENAEGGAKFIPRRRINAPCPPECATPSVRHI